MTKLRSLALLSFAVWTFSSIRRPNTRLSTYGTPSRLLARFQAALFAAGEERSALREVASAVILLGAARAAAVLARHALALLGAVLLGGRGGSASFPLTLTQKSLLNAGFRLASMIPGVSTVVGWEVRKELDKIERGMLGEGDPSALTTMPKRARRAAAIVAEARGLIEERNASWAPGEASKKWGGIYYQWQGEDGGEGGDHDVGAGEEGEEESREEEDEDSEGIVVVGTPGRPSTPRASPSAVAAAEAAALHDLQAEMMSTFNSTNLL